MPRTAPGHNEEAPSQEARVHGVMRAARHWGGPVHPAWHSISLG